MRICLLRLDTELPWITQFYVNLSHGIINYWFIIIPVIIAIVFGVRYFAKTNAGKHFFGKIALKLPLLKTTDCEVGFIYDGTNHEYIAWRRCSID